MQDNPFFYRNRLFLSHLVMLLTLLFPWQSALGYEFEFGTLDFNNYDDSYAYINVINTTGDSGSLIQPGVDFINGEIWFSLATDNSGTNFTNYHLILNQTNSDDWQNDYYDWLTGMYFGDYDSSSNTYSDGEDVSSIGPGKSLINRVSIDSSQLYIPFYDYDTYTYSLYIKDLRFTAQVELDNFSTTLNGVSYYYNGTLDISSNGNLFDDNWYKVADVAGQSGSSITILGNIPEENPSASVPEPSTLILVSIGLTGLIFRKKLFSTSV